MGNQSSSKKTKRPAAPDTQTPVKKVRKSSPAPITSSGDDHKDVVNIKDDPEVMASASTSHQAVNPEVDADFGEEFDESYDGYYDEQGEEVGETGEATDGTKGRHTFFCILLNSTLLLMDNYLRFSNNGGISFRNLINFVGCIRICIFLCSHCY